MTRQVDRCEPGKPAGGLRKWLATIARNTAVDAIRRVRPNAARRGTSVHEQLQDVAEQSEPSENELRRELDRQAFRWVNQ